MDELNYKLSWGLVHLGYNVPNNYACSNQATYTIIKETWVHKDKVPTEEKILKAYDEWVEAEKKIQYQRDRAVAYPSIQDVVVALAEKEEGNDAMWQEITAQRAKVKADNPKP